MNKADNRISTYRTIIQPLVACNLLHATILPNDKLAVVSKIYPEETHMTSVMPALLEGLKWLYSRCKAQQDCEF